MNEPSQATDFIHFFANKDKKNASQEIIVRLAFVVVTIYFPFRDALLGKELLPFISPHIFSLLYK